MGGASSAGDADDELGYEAPASGDAEPQAKMASPWYDGRRPLPEGTLTKQCTNEALAEVSALVAAARSAESWAGKWPLQLDGPAPMLCDRDGSEGDVGHDVGDGDAIAEVGKGELAAIASPLRGTGSLPYLVRFGGLVNAFERAACIVEAAIVAQQGSLVLEANEIEDKVLEHFLATKVHTTSQSAEADKLGVSRKTLGRLRTLSASAGVLLHNRDAARMLGQVAADVSLRGGRCMVLVETYKGDETTLYFKVADTEPIQALGQGGNEVAVANSAVALQATAVQSAATKVLQSHRSLAALFHTSEEGYFSIVCPLVAPLQVMASTKMDVYFKCFQQTALPLATVSSRFERHIRICTTDGDSSVQAGLRAVGSTGPAKQLHHKCDIHKLSNALTYVTSPKPVSEEVGSLLRMALSLRAANTMRLFRESLRVVIMARLRFVRRRPRQSDLDRNIALVSMCIPSDSRSNRLRQQVIIRLFNGDWSKADAIEHNCIGERCCLSEAHCLEKMVSAGVAAVAASCPPEFPRSRWTGRRHGNAMPSRHPPTKSVQALCYMPRRPNPAQHRDASATFGSLGSTLVDSSCPAVATWERWPSTCLIRSLVHRLSTQLARPRGGSPNLC